MGSSLTVAEVAARLGAGFEGDGSALITGVAGVRDGGPGDLAFVAQSRYAADAEASQATALLVPRDWSSPARPLLLRVDQPMAAFAEIARWFAPPPVRYPPGIHPTAVVAPSARIGAEVHLGPHVVVEEGAVIGDRCVLLAGVFVGQGAVLGEQALLYPGVSLREHVRLGARVIVHNGTVIGSDGFGYDVDAKGVRTKIPQIGTVVVGDDVEIGANCAIDRARFGRTRIGNGVKIDNLVQIAHNVVIGDHTVLVAQVGIAGSTIVGRHAILAGQVGVAGHLVIGDHAVVGAQGGVTKDVPAKTFVSGYPAMPHRKAAEQQANIHRLPQLKARVAALEKRIAELDGSREAPPAGS